MAHVACKRRLSLFFFIVITISEATQEGAEYEHRNKRRSERQLRQLEAINVEV